MFNKATIDKLLEMPDEKLTIMLNVILSAAGIKAVKPDAAGIAKIRRVLAEITDSDIERVLYLSEIYKNGG